ncbi:hypothetical protein M0R72_06165 [Candidatus Pacearchaeota archaeon]|jgi:hypothetical protein|nr:hypothetical protein [Candidatus Pacearchaeota archaeon]
MAAKTSLPTIVHIPPKTKREFDKHEVSHALLSLPDVMSAIANTSDAKLTKMGLKLNVVRYQPDDQAGGRAIRTGVFYLPELKSPYQKYYTTGKQGYGGGGRYEGETTYRYPLVVKGVTGGKCPQMAYDFILGKKSYDGMRSEVLKNIYGWWSPKGSSQQQAVEGILEKYHGKVLFAYDIVANSMKGNTLAYAIQEHIVACEVRRSGYDSVIGYTKYKESFRLSEVFDLREEEYPWQPHWKNNYDDFYREHWSMIRDEVKKR